MKILVTGGAGYIGSHTVVELANAGYEPVIVDNFCNSRHSVIDGLREILGRDIVYHEGDCCNIDFMQRVFYAEEDIAGAIHFAALKAVGESIEKPELYRQNNIGSLETLMEVMQQHHVPLLVFSSSACVYGEADVLPVTEETPLKKPESPYGETKQVCEEIIQKAVNDGRFFHAVSLRYFNPIGAHASAKIGELPLGVPNNLVPFVTQTAAGRLPQLTVFGDDYPTPDGTAVRDYIHVVDLARAHVDALKHLASSISHLASSKSLEASGSQSVPGISHLANSEQLVASSYYNVFNLGTGTGNSVMEVIRTFEEVSRVKLNYKIGPRRKGDIAALYANCDKALRELGWKAQLTLADGLRDSWRWQCALG
jgi:UDP-glucose 4-epimerase